MGYKIEFVFCYPGFERERASGFKYPSAIMTTIPRIGEEVFIQCEDGEDVVYKVINVRYVIENPVKVFVYLSE